MSDHTGVVASITLTQASWQVRASCQPVGFMESHMAARSGHFIPNLHMASYVISTLTS